ncbi:hypothetical protein HDU85_007459 [Gaertneriomyces sp. JEL0708]|nr:hypothetical protein HDU85_007459 [Gaertneriomyces sp. JEL0708]
MSDAERSSAGTPTPQDPPTSDSNLESSLPPNAIQRRRPSSAALATLDNIATDLKRSSMYCDGIITRSNNTSNKTTTITENDLTVNDGGGVDIRVLLEHAKQIVVQLRDVMEVDYHETDLLREDDGTLPSYPTLVSKLSSLFAHQQSINRMHSKLVSVNYMIQLSNFARNRALQKSVLSGRRQIVELQHTVRSLEGEVERLGVESDVQRKSAERLKIALDSTRRLLEETIVEYRWEMGRQREVLRRQGSVIGELYKSKFNQDFILDSLLFFFCIWAVNTSVVDVPLRTVSDFVVQLLRYYFPASRSNSLAGSNASSYETYRRRAAFTRQSAKVAVVLWFMRKLRRGAADYGIHNRIGSTYPYITSFFGMMYSSVAKRTGLAVVSSNAHVKEVETI